MKHLCFAIIASLMSLVPAHADEVTEVQDCAMDAYLGGDTPYTLEAFEHAKQWWQGPKTDAAHGWARDINAGKTAGMIGNAAVMKAKIDRVGPQAFRIMDTRILVQATGANIGGNVCTRGIPREELDVRWLGKIRA